jgi:hypothetical protein
VKEKIAKEKGWEASQQKLIYSGSFTAEVDFDSRLAYKHLGKILQDGNTVESYKIEEKGFIVCMIQKVWCLPFILLLFLTVNSPRLHPPLPPLLPLLQKPLQPQLQL